MGAQVTLFHQAACEAVGEEALVELADWAYRKLTWLNSGEAHQAAMTPGVWVLAAHACTCQRVEVMQLGLLQHSKQPACSEAQQGMQVWAMQASDTPSARRR